MSYTRVDRSKEKLKGFIKSEITKIFTQVLDYAEVAVDSEQRYKNLRSKILKVSNDAIRDVKKEIDSRYTVEYTPPAEDVILVKNNRKQ